MKKSEFKNRLDEIISTAKEQFICTKFEAVNNWMGTPVNVFQYSATSERCMERNLSECGKERKTTFMSDLSIGEWYGLNGVLDTVKNAVSSWKDDEKYMAESELNVISYMPVEALYTNASAPTFTVAVFPLTVV